MIKTDRDALNWYDEALDNSIDFLGLDRDDQQAAWNILDRLIDNANGSPSANEINKVAKWICDTTKNTTRENIEEAIEDVYSKIEFESVVHGKQADKKKIKMYELQMAALMLYEPWISVATELPKEKDGDQNGEILTYSEGLKRQTICKWYNVLGDNTTTHWRHMILNPEGEK